MFPYIYIYILYIYYIYIYIYWLDKKDTSCLTILSCLSFLLTFWLLHQLWNGVNYGKTYTFIKRIEVRMSRGNLLQKIDSLQVRVGIGRKSIKGILECGSYIWSWCCLRTVCKFLTPCFKYLEGYLICIILR